MKRTALTATLVLLGAPAALAASGVVEKRELVCMMQDMVLNKPGIAIEHNGKTYYGCCEMCRDKIKSAPERYIHAVDPVSGKKVDKAVAFIYNLEGDAVYFGSEANRRLFAENPPKYRKK